MTVLAYKRPVNYRSQVSRTPSPEAIEVSASGFAVLAESPADPGNQSTPMAVTIGGESRTRVVTTPTAGQYRVLSQTVTVGGQQRSEYLPVLEFHSSDYGLSGTADYYRSGTVLTEHWFDSLMTFLTPLVDVADESALNSGYPATSSLTRRGRPGDVAFLQDGSFWFSDGTQWRQVSGAGSASWAGGMSLASAVAMALDAAYAGPDLEGEDSFSSVFEWSSDGAYESAGAWVADVVFGGSLGLTVDAVAEGNPGATFGASADVTFSAVVGLVASVTAGISAGTAFDSVFAAGSSATVTRSSTGLVWYDDFNRESVGSDWTAVSGSWSMSSNRVRCTTTGSGARELRRSLGSSLSRPLYASGRMKCSSDPGDYQEEFGVFRFFDDTTTVDGYDVLYGNATTEEWEGEFYYYGLSAIREISNGNASTRSSTDYLNKSTTEDNVCLSVGGSGESNNIEWWLNGTSKRAVADTTVSSCGQFSVIAADNDYSMDFDDIAVTKGYKITCTGLPTGYKLRCGGSSGVTATESSGTATVSLGGKMFPLSLNSGLSDTVEVLNGSDVVQATFTASADVWGGDAYEYSE